MQSTAEESAVLSAEPVDKKIKLKEQHYQIADKIGYAHSVTPATSRVLAARGFTVGDKLTSYLRPTLRDGLPSPADMKNLLLAAEKIGEHFKHGNSIAICCDFDVDGLSSGAQVYHYLHTLGAKVKVYVPDRFKDGYGLNSDMIREIAEAGHKLVVTLDFGTTNIEELKLARELGLESIVVDHHHVEANPPSDIFINPQQEGCGFADGTLCAAGLAWYLLIALRKVIPEAKDLDPKRYLDLACLGTICDMVPLHGVNRIIARRGLETLSHTDREGLIALKNVLGIRKKMSCSHISFGIGPRLNAAGRMVHGSLVIELLTTADSKLADKLAKKLHKLNKERQETEEAVKEKALELAAIHCAQTPALMVWDEDFHTGVIGIVAQRLVEYYYRPSTVMGMEGGVFKGSVRGIKGFNVVDTLSRASRHLEKFGGHEGAGGFSVLPEKIEDFQKDFYKACEENLKGIDLYPTVEADTTATLSELTPALIKEMKSFEPHGIGNPGPVLLLEDLEVKEVKVLKNAHLKVILSNGQQVIPGLMWRRTSHPDLEPGKRVRVACRPDINNFRGMNELQATIQAVEAV